MNEFERTRTTEKERMQEEGWQSRLFFLPGAYVTDETHLYEVVYGIGDYDGSGWVALQRTDLVDEPADRYNDCRPTNYTTTLVCWQTRAECCLRLVRKAPSRHSKLQLVV